MDMALAVNGWGPRLSLGLRMALLDTLRGRPGLAGAWRGCDQGRRGANAGPTLPVKPTGR